MGGVFAPAEARSARPLYGCMKKTRTREILRSTLFRSE